MKFFKHAFSKTKATDETIKLTKENALEYIQEAVKRADKKSKESAGKHCHVIGRSTVFYDWESFFKENPETWERERKKIKRFFDKYGEK